MSAVRIVPAIGTGACVVCAGETPECSSEFALGLPYVCGPCLDTHTITNLGDGTLRIEDYTPEPDLHADCMPEWCVLPPSDPRHENHPVPTHGDAI